MTEPNVNEMTIEQELAYALHLAVQMMDEAYPETKHDEMPEAARRFDSFVGSSMSANAYKHLWQYEKEMQDKQETAE